MRKTSFVLLVLYIAFIARMTLTDQSGAVAGVATLHRLWEVTFPFVPSTWTGDEGLANLVLFVPLGFLLTLVTQRPLLSLLLCVLGSAGIELAQQMLLPTRVPTWADVQNNGLGGAVGVLLAVPFLAIAALRSTAPRAAG